MALKENPKYLKWVDPEHPSLGDPVLSPVSNLPDDLLVLIFLLDVIENPSLSPFPATSQVCRRWRDVAVNAGNLWLRIPITDRKSVDAARILLQRSKEGLLEITLRPTLKIKNHQDRTLAVRNLKTIHSMLVPLVGRIKHITLEWTASLPLLRKFFLTLAASPESTSLRGFKMTTPGLVVEVDIANGYPVIPDGPDRPSTLNLAQQIMINAPSRSKKGEPRYHFLWHKLSNLRRLVVYDDGCLPASIEYSQLYRVLQTSPGLEELSLQGIRAVAVSEPYNASSYPVQVMRSLRRLKMQSVDATAVAGLLDVIHAPNLQTLALNRSRWFSRNTGTLGQRIQAGLASVLESTSAECRPNLSVSLDCSYLEGSTSLEIYGPSFDSLRSIKLYRARDTSLVSSWIFTPLIEGEIRLRRLHLNSCHLSLMELATFVARRAESGRPLESLILENSMILHSFCGLNWMALLEDWLKERVGHVKLCGCAFDRPPSGNGGKTLSKVLKSISMKFQSLLPRLPFK